MSTAPTWAGRPGLATEPGGCDCLAAAAVATFGRGGGGCLGQRPPPPRLGAAEAAGPPPRSVLYPPSGPREPVVPYQLHPGSGTLGLWSLSPDLGTPRFLRLGGASPPGVSRPCPPAPAASLFTPEPPLNSESRPQVWPRRPPSFKSPPCCQVASPSPRSQPPPAPRPPTLLP